MQTLSYSGELAKINTCMYYVITVGAVAAIDTAATLLVNEITTHQFYSSSTAFSVVLSTFTDETCSHLRTGSYSYR